MQKISLLSCLLLICFNINTQGQQTGRNRQPGADFRKNIIKFNLFSPLVKSYSFQYERGISPDISIALGIRLQPKSSIPFKSAAETFIDNEADADNTGLKFVQEARLGGWALTPEFRYYFGKKPLNGFYLAPFLRFGGHHLDWNYDFKMEDGDYKPVRLDGSANFFSGGVLLGAQWHIREHIVLDWWILGPQYGNYKIKLSGSGDFSDLTPEDKQQLKENIEGIGYGGHKFKAEISDTRVTAENKLGIPGIRTGFCLAFTF